MSKGTKIAIGFIMATTEYTIKGNVILHIREKNKERKVAFPEPMLPINPIGQHIKVQYEGELLPSICLGKVLQTVTKIL